MHTYKYLIIIFTLLTCGTHIDAAHRPKLDFRIAREGDQLRPKETQTGQRFISKHIYEDQFSKKEYYEQEVYLREWLGLITSVITISIIIAICCIPNHNHNQLANHQAPIAHPAQRALFLHAPPIQPIPTAPMPAPAA